MGTDLFSTENKSVPFSDVRPLFGRRLLQSAAHGGDALRVEAEPVHAPDVARVLDLDAAIHDDRQAAFRGDARAFLVDDAELAPQVLRADGDGLRCDAR